MIGNLIFLGPPGVGKGTLAQKLSQKFNLKHISTGELFRQEIKVKSPLGQKVAIFLKEGSYVPDSITNQILLKELKKNNGHFILDGYPRTLEQADFLSQNKIKIDDVILLEAPHPILIKRLLDRKRLDDNFETIKKRIAIYQAKTQPLINYYQKQNKLIKVDASQTIEKNLDVLLKGLKYDHD